MRLGIDTNGDGVFEDIFNFGRWPWWLRLLIKLLVIALGIMLRRKGIVKNANPSREGGDKK